MRRKHNVLRLSCPCRRLDDGVELDTSRATTPVSNLTAVDEGVVAVTWIPCDTKMRGNLETSGVFLFETAEVPYYYNVDDDDDNDNDKGDGEDGDHHHHHHHRHHRHHHHHHHHHYHHRLPVSMF